MIIIDVGAFNMHNDKLYMHFEIYGQNLHEINLRIWAMSIIFFKNREILVVMN